MININENVNITNTYELESFIKKTNSNISNIRNDISLLTYEKEEKINILYFYLFQQLRKVKSIEVQVKEIKIEYKWVESYKDDKYFLFSDYYSSNSKEKKPIKKIKKIKNSEYTIIEFESLNMYDIKNIYAFTKLKPEEIKKQFYQKNENLFFKFQPNYIHIHYGRVQWVSYIDNPNKNCFVATATFGSPHHPIVKDFREYRDQKLQYSFLGNYFIKIYYCIAPFLSEIILSNKLLLIASRYVLVKIHKIIQEK